MNEITIQIPDLTLEGCIGIGIAAWYILAFLAVHLVPGKVIMGFMDEDVLPGLNRMALWIFSPLVVLALMLFCAWYILFRGWEKPKGKD